jgi:uncharacterized protein YggE
MTQEAFKKGVISLVLILMIFAFSACEGEKPGLRLITVTGDAEVRVPPDEVILSLGVETWHKDLGIAKTHNDERVKKVMALAKKYNIAPGNIWIDRINIEPRYKDGDVQADIIGYDVLKTVVLIVRDLSRFDDLISSALEAGANHVYEVQFRTTKLRDYRDQARALALKAAKEKAKDMAKDLGQKIGKTYTIIEEEYERDITPQVRQVSGADLAEAEKSIALGQIGVSARVRVSFELR